MRRILFLCCLILGLTAARAEVPAAATATPAAQGGLDVLAAYAGPWHVEIHFLETPYSHARDTAYKLRNDCWRSAGFYACDQFVDGQSKVLVVYSYDSTRGYSSFPIPAGTDQVHVGHLDIQDKVWTFPWKVAKDGKTTYFHVINTWDSPDSIQFRQEYSADGQQWTLMAQGHETRIRDLPSKQP
jgi:hypothetical protein